MRRMSRFSFLLILVVVATVVAACSSGSGSSATPKGEVKIPDAVDRVPANWSPPAVARMRDLAGRLSAISPETCKDLAVMSTNDFRLGLVTMQTATVVPRTIGGCTVGDENVEIVIFSGPAGRDRFIKERHDRLCTISQRNNLDFPGLRFAKGRDWTMQTDTESVARDVIDVLGGKYQLAACAGQTATDWDRASVLRLRALAARLNAAGYKCAFALDDKDLIKKEKHYREIGLPGALGSCPADFGPDRSPTFGLAGFSPGVVSAEKFLPAELAELCRAGADVRVVRGDKWAAFVVTESTAQIVADALGGEVDPMTCPTPVQDPAATSTTSPAP